MSGQAALRWITSGSPTWAGLKVLGPYIAPVMAGWMAGLRGSSRGGVGTACGPQWFRVLFSCVVHELSWVGGSGWSADNLCRAMGRCFIYSQVGHPNIVTRRWSRQSKSACISLLTALYIIFCKCLNVFIY